MNYTLSIKKSAKSAHSLENDSIIKECKEESDHGLKEHFILLYCFCCCKISSMEESNILCYVFRLLNAHSCPLC
jgi:hypothetical protein